MFRSHKPYETMGDERPSTASLNAPVSTFSEELNKRDCNERCGSPTTCCSYTLAQFMNVVVCFIASVIAILTFAAVLTAWGIGADLDKHATTTMPTSTSPMQQGCLPSCPESALPAPLPSLYNALLPHPLHPLYPDEYRAVEAYLRRIFTLTDVWSATKIADNYLWSISLAYPPKADYLIWKAAGAQPDSPLKPKRYAFAIVVLGSPPAAVGSQEPTSIRYRVGPLPWQPGVSTAQVESFLPFDKRPISGFEYHMDPLVENFFDQISDLVLTSWGTSNFSAFYYWVSTPRGYQRYDTKRSSWAQLGWNDLLGGTAYLRPIGLELFLNYSDPDPSKWSILQISYNAQLFASVEALLLAWQSDPAFELISYPNPGDFGQFARKGVPSPGQSAAPPNHMLSGGRRFSVSENIVEYLGWKLMIGQYLYTGLSLFDISFMNETIVYEMSPVAASALYGGRFAYPSSTRYEDGGYGMGSGVGSLIQGVDCPLGAVYLDYYSYQWGTGLLLSPKSICIFEQDLAEPSMRHAAETWIEGIQSTALVIRAIPTVGNYDYVMSTIFYPDGTIESKTQMTGYVQAGPWKDGTDNNFGFQIGPRVMGQIHDHFFLHKIDIDLLQPENRLTRITAEYGQHPSNPYLPPSKIQRSLKRTPIVSEIEAIYDVNLKSPSLSTFHSDAINQYGNLRSYTLKFKTDATPQLPSDLELFPSFSWLTNNMFVTVRKETESAPVEAFFEQTAADDPVIQFSNFYQDDESIVDQDLVIWTVCGALHFPQSEDIPVTPTPSRGVGFTLSPYNFFDRNSMSRLDQRIRYENKPDELEARLVYNSLNHNKCISNTDTPLETINVQAIL